MEEINAGSWEGIQIDIICILSIIYHIIPFSDVVVLIPKLYISCILFVYLGFDRLQNIGTDIANPIPDYILIESNEGMKASNAVGSVTHSLVLRKQLLSA